MLDENIGLPLIEGSCIPDSCSAGDMKQLINSSQFEESFLVNPAFEDSLCQTNHDAIEFSYLLCFTM